MIRYSFIDIDGNEFEISTANLSAEIERSIKRVDDTAGIEVDIVEKSNQAGADFPGIQRDESKDIILEYNFDEPTDAEFLAIYNLFCQKMRSARWLRDKQLNRETAVVLFNESFNYDSGGFLRGGVGTISFKQLRPFWQDIEYTTETDSGFSTGQFVINNQGFIETPPLITITALENISKIGIYIEENGRGIFIDDLQFGNVNLDTYIIDNQEGTAELNGIDRRSRIRSGTGFFKLQPGINTVNIELNGLASIEIQYKKRFYR